MMWLNQFPFLEPRTFSREEIAALSNQLKNDDRDHAMKFTIIDSKVYDVTEFVHEHPGGEQVLLTHVGKDASGTVFLVDCSVKIFSLLLGDFGKIGKNLNIPLPRY
jgi:cytochrome b involved in lipid metabolism